MMPMILSLLVLPLMMQAGNYSAQRIVIDAIEVIQLKDGAHKIEVSVVPSLGNNAYEIKANGKNVLWSPYQNLKQFADKPVQLGNPLLAPWANRIQGDGYWANGRRYLLNPELRNFRYDANKNPMHGLLSYAREWNVIRVQADGRSATVTSRLEFWRRPDWMAQFPFAHNIEVTYRLMDGALEVETAVENLSSDPMPISLGYHTYYQIEDSTRDDCRIHVPARSQVMVSDALIPTGEMKPATLSDPQPLRGQALDTGFTNLVRDAAGHAEFWVQGKQQKIRIVFGAKYDVAVIYSPPGRNFICFEPMVGTTNVFNLSQAGLYKDLQSIPPGGSWKESFWIIPEGY